MANSTLFDSMQLGDLELSNRVVMAPLTRCRALPDGDVPYDIHAEHYAQRASAGLIITEATQISPEGKGNAWTPGIYSDEQIKGWRLVTDAVHAKGGKIFIQLWHVGRISHTSLQPNGQAPVAPSVVASGTEVFSGEGRMKTSTPRALELSEIPRLIEDYRKAAINAKEAGFDGIELHSANGYLLDQFLRDGTNKRTDKYGGPIENRARLTMEVLEALTEIWPANRVGIRLSPFSHANGITFNNPMREFAYVIEQLNQFGLAYLHLVEGETRGSRELPEGASISALRGLFNGVYMANNGYDRDMALDVISSGDAELVAFGRDYIANPDLVERLQQHADLNEVDASRLYGGGAEGYNDYPTLKS